MKDLLLKGTIYSNGKFYSGIYSLSTDTFVDDNSTPDLRGTLLKGPINFHTHLGDSFISKEADGDIAQIVGPGGFKMRELNSATPEIIKESIKRSVEFIISRGTAAFIDFRESGLSGLRNVPKDASQTGFFLTRPGGLEDSKNLLQGSSGFGMSSISDHDFSSLLDLSNIAKGNGKVFAIHFSENTRENVDDLLKLKPDYIIHCIEATPGDLSILREASIPIVITPRSNIFYGKRPDYAKLIQGGLTVLLGTDNAFITEPDIMGEAEFLYRYQKGLQRVSPEEIMKIIIDNPRVVMDKLGLKLRRETYILFEDEDLTPYQIITRPHFYNFRTIIKQNQRITFFPRNH